MKLNCIKKNDDTEIKEAIEILMSSLVIYDPFEETDTINLIHKEIQSLQTRFTTAEYKDIDYYTKYLTDTISLLDRSNSTDVEEIRKFEVLLILYNQQMFTTMTESVFTRSAPFDPIPVTAFFAEKSSSAMLAPPNDEMLVKQSLATASY